MTARGALYWPLEPGNQTPLHKYSPDQPRVPAGEPGAGQWTSGTQSTNDLKEGSTVTDNETTELASKESINADDASGLTPEPATSSNGNTQALEVQSIIDTAQQLNVAAGPDAYQKCLDLCYPLLERFQPPGSDRSTWDFHKCMNACLGRNL